MSVFRPRRHVPKPPQLPETDFKVILRPRDGLNTTSWSSVLVSDSIKRATALEAPPLEYTIRLNTSQNLIIVSTPSEDNAIKYSQIKELILQDKKFGMTNYITAPENSAKGIIHGIPDYDPEEDIINSLARNTPRVLHARRMGKTASAIIVFEGKAVPHYIDYRNTTYRCLLYKKKIEVCSICRKKGHREDVCPTPKQRRCIRCGKDNPPTDQS